MEVNKDSCENPDSIVIFEDKYASSLGSSTPITNKRIQDYIRVCISYRCSFREITSRLQQAHIPLHRENLKRFYDKTFKIYQANKLDKDNRNPIVNG